MGCTEIHTFVSIRNYKAEIIKIKEMIIASEKKEKQNKKKR